MGIREQVGQAVNTSDLGEDDRYTTDVNRVAALGQAGKLGRLLWHWKYGRDETCAMPAFNLLVRRAAKRLRIRHAGEAGKADYETLRHVCAQVLQEWLHPHCRACNGAQQAVNERGVMTACPSCGGSGVHRYRDADRMRAARLGQHDYERAWARRFAEVMGIVTGCDIHSGAVVITQLNDDHAKIVAEPELA